MNTILRQQWLALSTWLGNLPFFWAVLTLTLIETIGEGILAVPLAVTRYGLLTGIGVLVGLGLVNLSIMSAIAKASQAGSISYEDAYLGVLAIPLLASILVHGLIIWQYPLGYSLALCVTVTMLILPIVLIRQGVFTTRTVLDLRQDLRTGGQSTFAITSNGQPTTAQVCLSYARGAVHLQTSAGMIVNSPSLQFASFLLSTRLTRELRVLAYRVTAQGQSEGLPAFLEVNDGSEIKQFDLSNSDGRVLLPLTSKMCSLKIVFAQSADSIERNLGGVCAA